MIRNKSVLVPVFFITACCILPGCIKSTDRELARLSEQVLRQVHEGELSGALDTAEEATQMAPERAEAWWMLGWVRLKRQEYDKAGEALDRAVEMNPDNAQFRETLAEALFLQGQYADATTHARRAIDLDPRSSEARVTLGKSLLEAGNEEEALDVLEESVELDQANVNARAQLGYALWLNGDYEGAIAEFDEALELDQTRTDLHIYRGRILEELRRPEEALSAYRAAVEVDSNDLHALTGLCRVLCYSGEYVTATELLEGRARRSTPSNGRWFAALRAWVVCFAGSTDRSEVALSEEHSGEQTQDERLLRAMAWVWLEEWDRAISCAEDAVTIHAPSQEAHATLDIAVVLSRGCERPHTHVRFTNSMTPDKSVVPEAALGYCLALDGDAVSARVELDSIDEELSADYFRIEPAYIAGLAYRELGDTEGSNELFRRSIDRWPKHPWSQKMREMMKEDEKD
jgi:tetratricopeptide (TPR) repeat protein